MFTWLIGILLYFWLALSILLVSVVTRAMALTVLWAWFVEPTFGLGRLSLPMAAGLIIVVYLVFSSTNYLTSLREKSRRPSGEAEGNSVSDTVLRVGMLLAHEVITPVSAVALGWILKQVVG